MSVAEEDDQLRLGEPGVAGDAALAREAAQSHDRHLFEGRRRRRRLRRRGLRPAASGGLRLRRRASSPQPWFRRLASLRGWPASSTRSSQRRALAGFAARRRQPRDLRRGASLFAAGFFDAGFFDAGFVDLACGFVAALATASPRRLHTASPRRFFPSVVGQFVAAPCAGFFAGSSPRGCRCASTLLLGPLLRASRSPILDAGESSRRSPIEVRPGLGGTLLGALVGLLRESLRLGEGLRSPCRALCLPCRARSSRPSRPCFVPLPTPDPDAVRT